MDEQALKQLAVEAATERVVGQSSVPLRAFASLIKAAKGIIDEYKKEHAAWKRAQEEQERRYREIERDLLAYARELSRISKIEGEPGYTPVKGKDYFDGDPGKPGKDAVVDYPRVVRDVMKQIRQPKDGNDAILSDEKLEKLVEEGLKTYKKRLDDEVASYRNQLAGKVYGQDTWARGGGDTISAGSNITLVRKANGTVEINASGGGSGTNVTTQYQVTAVQSGSDVTIDLTQLTNWATFSDLILVMRNNIPQTEDINFTVSGSIVTVNNADAEEIFNIQYAYS